MLLIIFLYCYVAMMGLAGVTFIIALESREGNVSIEYREIRFRLFIYFMVGFLWPIYIIYLIFNPND